MALSQDVSPIGWYVGTYQLRFTELKDKKKNDPKKRFLTWENTALVSAKSRAEAYKKLCALGEEHTHPYQGGEKAIDVQWVFEGIVELVPIHEELGDGAEILWAEETRTLAETKQRARTAAELGAVATRPAAKAKPATKTKPAAKAKPATKTKPAANAKPATKAKPAAKKAARTTTKRRGR